MPAKKSEDTQDILKKIPDLPPVRRTGEGPLVLTGVVGRLQENTIVLRSMPQSSALLIFDEDINNAEYLGTNAAGIWLSIELKKHAVAHPIALPIASAAAIPFMLVNPHHIDTVRNPESLGGDMPVANLAAAAMQPMMRRSPGDEDNNGNNNSNGNGDDNGNEENNENGNNGAENIDDGPSEWELEKGSDLLTDEITLEPPGPPTQPPPTTPPPSGPTPGNTPPPGPANKGTDTISDLTIWEGGMPPIPKPPHTDWGPLLPQPQPQPPGFPPYKAPWADPTFTNTWTDMYPPSDPFPFPPPGAKGTDLWNDQMTVPPYSEGDVDPSPPETNYYLDLLQNGSAQFGDPYGLDWQWPF